MTLKKIASTTRARRLELGLSQAKLAERAGVSRKWINEFEQGKSSAELGLVLRVCDALGLELTVARVGAERPAAAKTPGTEAAPAELMAALEESLARARSGRRRGPARAGRVDE